MNKNKKNSKVVPKKRNNNLEPFSLGAGLIFGYNKEIREDDHIEFSYRLPLGAIKRLFKSYYEDILSVHQEFIYMGQTSSLDMRTKRYCYEMIDDIVKQLEKHNLNGKKIFDKVFDQYFKSEYEKMKRFSKKHGQNIQHNFKPCTDPKCCEPDKPSKGIKDL